MSAARGHDAFVAGVAFAVAELVRRFERPDMLRAFLHEAGLSLADLRAAGADEADLTIISKAMEP